MKSNKTHGATLVILPNPSKYGLVGKSTQTHFCFYLYIIFTILFGPRHPKDGMGMVVAVAGTVAAWQFESSETIPKKKCPAVVVNLEIIAIKCCKILQNATKVKWFLGPEKSEAGRVRHLFPSIRLLP